MKKGEGINCHGIIVGLPDRFRTQIGNVSSAITRRNRSQVQGPCLSADRGATVRHDTPRDHSRPRGRIGQ